jgi:TonB family protein
VIWTAKAFSLDGRKMKCVLAGSVMRNLRSCSLAFLVLVCLFTPSPLWCQQFDPRERVEVPGRVRLSESTLSSLLKNTVLPSYPVDAQNKGIQGTVVLMLSIEKDGRVSGVTAVSGDSLLAASAIGAAKRLRFRSYYLDEEAVPTEGQIIYLFTIVPGKGATVILARTSSLKSLEPPALPH